MKVTIATGTYKSLEAGFEWTEIPTFAVITGENGSGKTQLLEAINAQFQTNKQLPEASEDFRCDVDGFTASSSEVMLITDFARPQGAGAMGLAEVQSDVQSLYQGLLARERNRGDPHELMRAKRLAEFLQKIGLDPDKITVSELEANLPDGIFIRKADDILKDLSLHYINYQLDRIQLGYEKVPEAEILERIGPPPWVSLATLLESSGISHSLVTPEEMKVRDKYQLLLKDRSSGVTIRPESLSSGERSLFLLYVWLFIAEKKYSFPKLVMLDEPDSHLHPAQIKDFISSIKNGLVDTLGVRVIMTTHRTESIAFTPDNCLFEMRTNPTRIEKSQDKGKAIALIAGNLVTVVGDKRPVYVEDEDDVAFYNAAVNTLKRTDPKLLTCDPCMVSASVGRGVQKQPGGRGAVKQWVAKLQKAGLNGIVRGIIDRDNGNAGTDGVQVLQRYSFENYLYDPIVVYAVLLAEGKAPQLSLSEEIAFGDEHKLGELPESDLQTIADYICKEIGEKAISPKPTSSKKSTITYTNDKKVVVPAWLIDRRGHDLIGPVRKLWPDVHPTALRKAFQRVAMMPTCLRDTIVSAIR